MIEKNNNIVVTQLQPQYIPMWREFDTTHTKVKAHLHNNCYLMAFDNNTCIGRLYGQQLSKDLYFVHDIQTHKVSTREKVAKAFLCYLHQICAAKNMGILSWQRNDYEDINKWLKTCGFQINKRKIFVEKYITNYTSPYNNPFSFVCLADVEEEFFIDEMTKAASGDPFEDWYGGSPQEKFAELIHDAGETFDPKNWQLVKKKDQVVGVVLPQIYSDMRDLGTIFYLGVKPEFRNQGYGCIIHAYGMEMLTRNRVVRYVGSTDIENAGMLRVFEKTLRKLLESNCFFHVLNSILEIHC